MSVAVSTIYDQYRAPEESSSETPHMLTLGRFQPVEPSIVSGDGSGVTEQTQLSSRQATPFSLLETDNWQVATLVRTMQTDESWCPDDTDALEPPEREYDVFVRMEPKKIRHGTATITSRSRATPNPIL